MKKLTYKDIFRKILSDFNIEIHLEKISENKVAIKLKSDKYKYIWFDSDIFSHDKYDKIYIRYDKTEEIEPMVYDIFFSFIQKNEKYCLMIEKKDKDELLFQIPSFNSLEELAIKLEMTIDRKYIREI